MVEYTGNDETVARHLQKLHELITDNGGYIHDKLQICCENGHFTIRAPSDIPEGSELIRIPASCLLPMDQFHIGLENNHFILKSYSQDVTSERLTLMETVLALYNLTGKMAEHRATAPWMLYHTDKEFIKRITAGREIPGYDDHILEPENLETFLIDSFLRTRTLGGCKLSENDDKSAVTLVPLIEYMDHHPRGASFDVVFISERTDHITIRCARPAQGSTQCYAHYGPHDAYDTLLQYNYVERHAPYVRSIPLTIDLPDGIGRVEVHSQITHVVHENLPEQIKELQGFLPNIKIFHAEQKAVLGYLLIPHEKQLHSLRSVLGFVIGMLNQETAQNLEQLQHCVLEAETRILQSNRQFYEDLEYYLSTYTPPPEHSTAVEAVRDMVAAQKSKLEDYTRWITEEEE